MPQQHPTKPCHQQQATSPWTEAYRAQMTSSQAAPRASEQTMPERPFENETQAPTHDALSAIYNWGY